MKKTLIKFVYWLADILIVPLIKVYKIIGLEQIYLFLGAISCYVWWKAKLKNLGTGVIIWPTVVIRSPQNIEIGSNSSIGEFGHIWGGGGIRIGKHVLIASHVVITSVTHDVDNERLFKDTKIKREVVIEDNVWIGAGVVVLPGVNIGSGSVIGAGSVVTRDVPKNTVVYGIPGRVIRKVG